MRKPYSSFQKEENATLDKWKKTLTQESGNPVSQFFH